MKIVALFRVTWMMGPLIMKYNQDIESIMEQRQRTAQESSVDSHPRLQLYSKSISNPSGGTACLWRVPESSCPPDARTANPMHRGKGQNSGSWWWQTYCSSAARAMRSGCQPQRQREGVIEEAGWYFFQRLSWHDARLNSWVRCWWA